LVAALEESKSVTGRLLRGGNGVTETAELKQETTLPVQEYRSILLAVDSSDYSNHGIKEAAKLATLWNSTVTTTHAYAAQMHDVRFRQMEGGLPEQFREEQELERQRDVHDDLITRGLSIITDSYHEQVEGLCQEFDFPLKRRSLEGKNYRVLVDETNSGTYDLLVIGALGLGAVKGSRIGTVCGRVTKRSDIDVLVIKDIKKSIAEGPIVVALDGSTRSYGGLLTAFELAQKFSVPVKVVAAYDPYYHYVAFNRIAGVLSEEAGKVFKFKEQEKLHEEIIDSGLAKIYEGHLSVAESIAEDYGISIETELLAGKPHNAIEKFLRKTEASLLIIGKLGIHADTDLDIGGNAENLLHNVDCSVLLSQREHQPELDVLADVTTSWTTEAEKRMERVPEFVQNMARMAILRYAQEKGHTVITERIVEEATAQLMPGRAEQAMGEIVAAHDQKAQKNQDTGILTDAPMLWTDEATSLLLTIDDQALRDNLKMRTEKMARIEKSNIVATTHIAPFLDEPIEKESVEKVDQDAQNNQDAENDQDQGELYWDAAAIARLMRAPEGFMRDMSKARIEEYAREQELTEITLEVAEQGLSTARKAMEETMKNGRSDKAPRLSKCPFTNMGDLTSGSNTSADGKQIPWSKEAETCLDNVPEGYCLEMTRNAIETIAARSELERINADFVEQLMNVFASGSKNIEETLSWDDEARLRIAKAPDMIRGMLVKEIEAWAVRQQIERVDKTAVDTVKAVWEHRGVFHLDPDDPRNS
jgi:nucleotide-binding universal stress UspA family protein